MNIHLILLFVAPVFSYHTSDSMYMLRRRPSNYPVSPTSRQALGYSSPLFLSSPSMESEHRPLQLPSSLRHLIREPHSELTSTASRHLPTSFGRLLMKPHHMEDMGASASKEPAYYYIAAPQTRHKEPSFYSGRNFPPITQALRPQGNKFLQTALKKGYLMEDEIPFSMAEDTSFPIYSPRRKPLVHHLRPQVYDDFDQSSEHNTPALFIQPRPYKKDRSPMIMRSMDLRHHPTFHRPRYFDLDPMYGHEYQRPTYQWGQQRDADVIDEGQYEDQMLEVEESENKSRPQSEKKKRKKKKKKKSSQQQQESTSYSQGKKTDKEWMSIPEVITSEEMNMKSSGDDFVRRNLNSEEVDWSHIQPEEILRVNNHRNSTDSMNFH